jgi:hypothetical protein
MKRRVLLSMLLLMCSWALAQDAPAELPPVPDKGDFFFEVTTQYLSFSHRDLNGNMVLGNAAQVFYIPRVKSGFGFGIGFGRRYRSGLWSLSYLSSGHDVSFQQHKSTAVSNLVEFNARTFVLKTRALKLFVYLGLDFPWLKVYDNAADDRGRTYDATYLGLGVNAGAGVLVPVSARMFFSGSVVYRYLAYLYANGPGVGIDVTDLFDDRTGPRHHPYLRAPVLALELSLGYSL